MARYFVAIDLLRKLAHALEEGYTFDEEDPDVNVDMHYLFKNFAYVLWKRGPSRQNKSSVNKKMFC